MCDISILASSTKHATVQTLHCANKLIRKLESEEVILRFQDLGENSSLKLIVFSDSSMGNLPGGGHRVDILLCLSEKMKNSHLYAGSENVSGELYRGR